MTGNTESKKPHSNTAKEKRLANLKPFVKGDPRINTKGRPSYADALRGYGEELLKEIIEVKGLGKVPRGKALMLSLLTSANPQKVALGLAYTLGKPKENIDLDGNVVFQWLKDKTKPEADE